MGLGDFFDGVGDAASGIAKGAAGAVKGAGWAVNPTHWDDIGRGAVQAGKGVAFLASNPEYIDDAAKAVAKDLATWENVGETALMTVATLGVGALAGGAIKGAMAGTKGAIKVSEGIEAAGTGAKAVTSAAKAGEVVQAAAKTSRISRAAEFYDTAMQAPSKALMRVREAVPGMPKEGFVGAGRKFLGEKVAGGAENLQQGAGIIKSARSTERTMGQGARAAAGRSVQGSPLKPAEPLGPLAKGKWRLGQAQKWQARGQAGKAIGKAEEEIYDIRGGPEQILRDAAAQGQQRASSFAQQQTMDNMGSGGGPTNPDEFGTGAEVHAMEMGETGYDPSTFSSYGPRTQHVPGHGEQPTTSTLYSGLPLPPSAGQTGGPPSRVSAAWSAFKSPQGSVPPSAQPTTTSNADITEQTTLGDVLRRVQGTRRGPSTKGFWEGPGGETFLGAGIAGEGRHAMEHRAIGRGETTTRTGRMLGKAARRGVAAWQETPEQESQTVEDLAEWSLEGGTHPIPGQGGPLALPAGDRRKYGNMLPEGRKPYAALMPGKKIAQGPPGTPGGAYVGSSTGTVEHGTQWVGSSDTTGTGQYANRGVNAGPRQHGFASGVGREMTGVIESHTIEESPKGQLSWGFGI